MTVLDKSGIEFFRSQLLAESDRQMALFETEVAGEKEYGRIRLYEERMKIRRHFLICNEDRAGYDSCHPCHGVLGKLVADESSASLVWREIEGLRHSVESLLDPELIWENEDIPKARLTLKGRFTKRLKL